MLNIREDLDILNQLQEVTKDREAWCAAVCGVTKSRTRECLPGTEIKTLEKSSGQVVDGGMFCFLPGGLEMVRPLDGGRRRLGGWGQCQSKDWDLYLPTPSSPPSGQCQGDTLSQPAGSDFMTQLPGGMKREGKLTSLPASLLHARTHAHTLSHTLLFLSLLF